MVTTKEYYEKNKQHIKAYQAEYRARNREKWLEKNRLWRKAHPDKMREYIAKYSATAKGKYTKLKLRARQGNIPMDIQMAEFTEWYERQELKCYYCGRGVSVAVGQKKFDGLSIDRKDNSMGYFLGNMVFSCNRCNMAKGSWFTEREMLEIAQRYFHYGR